MKFSTIREALEHIGHLADRLGMSQRQLAIRAELNYTTVNNYFRGIREPEFDEIQKLASVVGLKAEVTLTKAR